MREILFRGKRVDNGEWVEGFLVQRTKWWIYERFLAGRQYSFHKYEVHPATIGQYTGLKDNENVKMFEGDRVRGNYGIPPRVVESVIEWKDGGFYIDTNGHTPLEATIKEGRECLDLTIIGNVHDKEADG